VQVGAAGGDSAVCWRGCAVPDCWRRAVGRLVQPIPVKTPDEMATSGPELRRTPPAQRPDSLDWPDWLRDGLRHRRRAGDNQSGDASVDLPAADSAPRSGRGWRRVLSVGLLALVIGAVAGALAIERQRAAVAVPRLSLQVPTAAPTAVPTPPPTPQVAISRSVVAGINIADIYRDTGPGVVHVNAFRSNGPAGAGPGFVIDQQGHILTSNHIVEGAERVLVRFNDG